MDKKDQNNIQFQNIQKIFEEIRVVIKDLLYGRAPPRVYTLWVREKWCILKLDILMSSHKIRANDVSFFGKVFDHSDEETKNLLIKFYLYGWLLPKVTLLNINLLVGDVHV